MRVVLCIIVFPQAHLCNICIENVISIDETSVLTAGNDITTFQVDGTKCGVAICYDANFDEFVKLYRKSGTEHNSINHTAESNLRNIAIAY